MKHLWSLMALLTAWTFPAASQDIGANVLGGLAAGALMQGESIAREAPGMLQDFVDAAEAGKEFPDERTCLAHLQLAVNLGAIARNMMPFSEVWIFEDERGPVGRFRVMFAGERRNLEAFCDGVILRSTEVPWGDGRSEPRMVEMSSMDSVLGALIGMKVLGLFDDQATEDLAALAPGRRDGPSAGTGAPRTGSTSGAPAVGIPEPRGVRRPDTADDGADQAGQLSNGAIEALVRGIRGRYRPSTGIENPEAVQVQLMVELSRDGRLIGRPTIVDGASSMDNARMAIARAGMTAILMAANDNVFAALPPQAYDQWRRMRLTFSGSGLADLSF